jgi:hypothetical protein
MEALNRIGMILEFLSFWLAAPEILGEERLLRLERYVEKPLEWIHRHSDALLVLNAAPALLVILILPFIVHAAGFTHTAHYAWILLAIMLTMPPLTSFAHLPQTPPRPRRFEWTYDIVFLLSLLAYYLLSALRGPLHCDDPPLGPVAAIRGALPVALLDALLILAHRASATFPRLRFALYCLTPAVALAWIIWPPIDYPALAYWALALVAAVYAVALLGPTWLPPLISRLRDDARIRLRFLLLAAVILTLGIGLQFIATF